MNREVRGDWVPRSIEKRLWIRYYGIWRWVAYAPPWNVESGRRLIGKYIWPWTEYKGRQCPLRGGNWKQDWPIQSGYQYVLLIDRLASTNSIVIAELIDEGGFFFRWRWDSPGRRGASLHTITIDLYHYRQKINSCAVAAAASCFDRRFSVFFIVASLRAGDNSIA